MGWEGSGEYALVIVCGRGAHLTSPDPVLAYAAIKVLPHTSDPVAAAGRHFFEDLPQTSPPNGDGLCASCHAGPALNVVSAHLVRPLVSSATTPAGFRYSNILTTTTCSVT